MENTTKKLHEPALLGDLLMLRTPETIQLPLNKNTPSNVEAWETSQCLRLRRSMEQVSFISPKKSNN